jgi:anti-anti-sigma factor
VSETLVYSQLISPTGEIDMATAPAAFCAPPRGPGGVVIVDLARVTFIDAAGIGALVQLNRSVRADGAELFVIQTPARIARTFRLAGLDEFHLGER